MTTKTAAKKPTVRKAAAPRPDMVVDVTPTKDDVPLLGGPGAGMAHVTDLPLTDLAPHPDNVRHHVDGLEEMAASMRTLGVLERLLVVPTPLEPTENGGAPFLVIAGHRRLASAQLAELATVPVEIRYDLDTLEKQVEAMLVENIHRKDLTPVEEGEAYQTLLDLGSLDEDGIAHATGRSLTTVRRRLRLAAAPVEVRVKVSDGMATLADVDALDEFADHPDLLKQAAAAMGTSNFKWDLQRIRAAKERQEREAAELERMVAAGVTLVTQGELRLDWTWWNSDHLPRPIDRMLMSDHGRAEHHTTCKHAVYLVDQHTEACNNPASHGAAASTAGPVESSEDEAERKRLIAEHEARQAEAAAAHEEWTASALAARQLRADYVTELLEQGINANQARATYRELTRAAFAGQSLLEYGEPEMLELARLLGAKPDQVDAAEDDWEACQDLVTERILETKNPATAALAGLYVAVQDIDTVWQAQWRQARFTETEADWVAYLKDLGYPLSTWEQKQLQDAQDAAAAERARRLADRTPDEEVSS